MASISSIKLPNGVEYNLKDNGALQLTGGSVTGPVSFGDSVSIDSLTAGDLVVNGSASFVNALDGTAANSTTGISIGDHSSTTIYGVSSSTTTASKVTVGSHSTDYGVTAAGSGSFTQGSFSGGSGSFSATVTNHVLSFSHTHTAATHGTDSHTHTAPTLGSKVPTVSASDVTVPIKNSSTTTVVTSTTHTVTDNGHTHTVTVS